MVKKIDSNVKADINWIELTDWFKCEEGVDCEIKLNLDWSLTMKEILQDLI